MTHYDIIVIGGGAAGLSAAETANIFGLKTALIERNHIGGDCTWYGCVPSKAILACANVAQTAREGAKWGVHSDSVRVDFAQVMAHVKNTIHAIYEEESPDILRAKGIDVYIAHAQFASSHSVLLSTGETLHAKYIIIAIGAKSQIPPVFANKPYLTHETLFDLEMLPQHLVIVGGGAVSIEMGQAFRRLGSHVTLIVRDERLLTHADPQASHAIATFLQREGVQILFNSEVQRANYHDEWSLMLKDGTPLTATHVLLATGKKPDVRGLAPEKAHLHTQDNAFVLSNTLQTSQKHIYAVGDVSGAPYFTHVAGSEAITAITNIALPFKGKKAHIAPYCLFTEPEVAHAGLTEQQARQQYHDVQVTQVPMTSVDRAMTEGKSDGFIKLVHGRNGKLYGAVIVGHQAGEMMNEWVQLIAKKGRVSDMLFAPHIYPTMGYSNVIPAIEFLRQFVRETTLGKWAKRVIRWLV
jgi:pyruvate/2-oxoglutarate dehydrogenase complex dihydrolipoamide dehydrogenase (E3) component